MPPGMTLHRFREGGKGRSSRFTRKRRGRRTFFSLFLPGDDEEGKHSECSVLPKTDTLTSNRREPAVLPGFHPGLARASSFTLHVVVDTLLLGDGLATFPLSTHQAPAQPCCPIVGAAPAGNTHAAPLKEEG